MTKVRRIAIDEDLTHGRPLGTHEGPEKALELIERAVSRRKDDAADVELDHVGIHIGHEDHDARKIMILARRRASPHQIPVQQ